MSTKKKTSKKATAKKRTNKSHDEAFQDQVVKTVRKKRGKKVGKKVTKKTTRKKVTKKKVVMGRPTKYSKAVQAAADDYVENHGDLGYIVPSVETMAHFLNVTRTTLYKWAEDTDKPEFSYTLERCKQKQIKELFNHGLMGTFNATITKLMLANHGYSDKVEQTGETETTLVFASRFDDALLSSD